MLKEDFYKLIDSLNLVNEDEEIPIKTVSEIEQEEKDKEKPETSESKDTRTQIKEEIEPQVEASMALIETIKLAFENKCDKTKKILNMEDQIKSWEKQMRGVCEQVVHVVEGKDFVVDKTVCSPRAYKKIANNTSRDMSVLDLCSAVIVFSNSLG